MITDQLKDLIRARPFRPFTICLTDGHEIEVNHPEFIMISPSGSTAIAYVGDDVAQVVQLVQVTRIRFATESSTPGRG